MNECELIAPNTPTFVTVIRYAVGNPKLISNLVAKLQVFTVNSYCYDYFILLPRYMRVVSGILCKTVAEQHSSAVRKEAYYSGNNFFATYYSIILH